MINGSHFFSSLITVIASSFFKLRTFEHISIFIGQKDSVLFLFVL